MISSLLIIGVFLILVGIAWGLIIATRNDYNPFGPKESTLLQCIMVIIGIVVVIYGCF